MEIDCSLYLVNRGKGPQVRIAKPIQMIANRLWPRGRRRPEFTAGLVMTWCVAVNRRLRCANRPYMMGRIVTSPHPQPFSRKGRRGRICSAVNRGLRGTGGYD